MFFRKKREVQHVLKNILNDIWLCIYRNELYNRRKFRTLTSDNMDTWKAKKRSKVRRKSSEKKGESLERRYTRTKCLESHESMIRSSGESKSRLAKAAGAELAAQHNNEKFHAAVARSTFSSQNAKNWRSQTPFWSSDLENGTRLWREAHLQVKIVKKCQFQTTFWSSNVEKLHTAVVRNTFPSIYVQNTCVVEHFWRFRCRKGVRHKK